MTTCPHCKASVEDTRASCASCGTNLQKPVKDPNSGQVIDRKYRLISLLGAGGMGMVYRAEHEVLRKEVAIKILSPAVSGDENVRKRFLREAQVTATLQHPNIVAALDAGVAGNKNLYIVMELVEGESLAERLNHGALPWTQAVRIAKEVASALVCAHHKNLVHRDLKPANIMLEKGSDRAKVLDFGIARVMEDGTGGEGTRQDLTRAGAGIGTLPYMSPEQLLGDKIDGRTDIYAFGVVLYEMLAGLRPLRAETQQRLFHVILAEAPPPVTETNPKVSAPAWLEKLIFACLEKDRDQRPPTMQAVLDSLDHGSPPVVAPAGGGGLARTGSGAKWVVVGLALLVAWAGVMWVGWKYAAPLLGWAPSNRPVAANNRPAPPANNGAASVNFADEAKKRAELEEQQRKAEAERKKKEEEDARRKQEEQAAEARKKAVEEEKRQQEEAAARQREEEAKKAADEEARRKLELAAQGKTAAAVRTQLQELLAKKDLMKTVEAASSSKQDPVAIDLLNRDLPGWEKLFPLVREAAKGAGSAPDRAARWEAIRRQLPFEWKLPGAAAEDLEAAAQELYGRGQKDRAVELADLALDADKSRMTALRVQALHRLEVKKQPRDAALMLAAYLDPKTAPDAWQDNVLAWSKMVWEWTASPKEEQDEAVERLTVLAESDAGNTARKARALWQRSWFHERRGDFAAAAGDLMEALDQPDNAYRAECHGALARVLWKNANGHAEIREKALASLESAVRENPDWLASFVDTLQDDLNDSDGLLTVARRFLPAKGVVLPAVVRFEVCYLAARASRLKNAEVKERKEWLDEAIDRRKEANADEDAVAELFSMRLSVHYKLGRYPEAKKDLGALKEMVAHHANDGGNWNVFRDNVKKFGDVLADK